MLANPTIKKKLESKPTTPHTQLPTQRLQLPSYKNNVATIQVSSKTSAEQIEDAVLNAIRNAGADMRGEWFQGAILPWAKQVAETERQRIDNNVC